MAGLFGSGPRSNILNTVQGSYTAMLNAEKQKGQAAHEAMGAFGKAISPKAIGMTNFKNDFKNADWSKPETYARAGQQLMSFDPAAGLSMMDKGRSLAASMAPKRDMQWIDQIDPETGITQKVAVNMTNVKAGDAYTSKPTTTIQEAQFIYPEDTVKQQDYVLAQNKIEDSGGAAGTTDIQHAKFLFPEDTVKQQAYVTQQTKLKDTGASSSGAGDMLSTLDPDLYTSSSLTKYMESVTEAAPNGNPNLLKRYEPLSASAEGELNDANDLALTARRGAAGTRRLAENPEVLDAMNSGVFGSIEEAVKSFFGTQDAVTEFKTEHTRITNSAIISSLPAGPASDKDISLISAGFPPSNSNPEVLKNWLDAFARLQDADATYNTFKANYISNNNNTKGMLRTWDKYTGVPLEMFEKYQAGMNNPAISNSSVTKQFKSKYGFDPKGLF